MTKTIPADQREAQVNAWVSTQGPLVQRIAKTASTRHGRSLTFHDVLTLHYTYGVARLRRHGHGVGDWEVETDPDDRPALTYYRPVRDHPDDSADRVQMRRAGA
jgi:hypothetical protein